MSLFFLPPRFSTPPPMASSEGDFSRASSFLGVSVAPSEESLMGIAFQSQTRQEEPCEVGTNLSISETHLSLLTSSLPPFTHAVSPTLPQSSSLTHPLSSMFLSHLFFLTPVFLTLSFSPSLSPPFSHTFSCTPSLSLFLCVL